VSACPKLALLRHGDVSCECPLIGVDRKWLTDRQNDANDHFGFVAFSCLLANSVGTGWLTPSFGKAVCSLRCQRIFGMEYDVNKPFHPKRFIHPPRVLQGHPVEPNCIARTELSLLTAHSGD